METLLLDPDRWERVDGYEFVHDTGIRMLLRETEPTTLFPDIKISSLVMFWMDGKPPFRIRTENSITREFYAKILFREAKACFDRVALLAKLAAE
jgi:hypothetical protein